MLSNTVKEHGLNLPILRCFTSLASIFFVIHFLVAKYHSKLFHTKCHYPHLHPSQQGHSASSFSNALTVAPKEKALGALSCRKNPAESNGEETWTKNTWWFPVFSSQEFSRIQLTRRGLKRSLLFFLINHVPGKGILHTTIMSLSADALWWEIVVPSQITPETLMRKRKNKLARNTRYWGKDRPHSYLHVSSAYMSLCMFYA